MLKIILLLIAASAALQEKPCAYWCEAPCTKKHTAFYCCSFEPSLVAPKEFLPPPCPDLCKTRPGNDPYYARNCKQEIKDLQAEGAYQMCRNFRSCDPIKHDLCCPDNCLPEKIKMCVKAS